MDYTTRWNNFQFRSRTYLDGRTLENYDDEYRFDLVKWVQHEPREVIDGRTGQKIISTEYCFTIGTLIWNEHEEDFEFESCGLRYLEHRQNGLEEWILAFANMKRIEIRSKDDCN